MQENLRHCLDQMEEEFNIQKFTKCLQKNNPQKKITAKYSYQILKSFVKKNLIIENGKATYKKLLPTEVDPLDITTEFIKKCRRENKISFWEYGGVFSTSAQFIMLGVSNNKHMPDWKVKFLKILLERHGEIYHAIETLLTYKHKSPSLMSEASREVLLELIPYWLGHKAGIDHDGLSAYDLLKEISRLSELHIPYKDGRDEVENYLTIFKKSLEDKNNDNDWPKKLAEKLVMITIPNNWTLDDKFDERKLVRYLTKAIKMKLTTELIIFQLANFWSQEIIDKTLEQLEYLSKNKIDEIRKYYNEFQLGRKVLPYLDDIEYCLKTINRLDDGELKSGWYGRIEYFKPNEEDEKINNDRFELDESHNKNDTYLGTGKPEYINYLDEVKENSKMPGRLRNRFLPFYEIKSKSYYENLLEKRITTLRDFVKGNEIDKAIKAAAFTLSYKLPMDSHYLWEGIQISEGLSKYGIGIDEKQIELSFRNGSKQGKQFIQKAIKAKGRWTINS